MTGILTLDATLSQTAFKANLLDFLLFFLSKTTKSQSPSVISSTMASAAYLATATFTPVFIFLS